MSDVVLELELRLLILRHGRQQVTDALATLGDATVEQVKEAITSAERQRVGRKRGRPTSEIVTKVFQDRPEIIPVVQGIARAYESKTFLPHLRDVQRFLDRVAGMKGRLKSRQLALRRVIEALRRMDDSELLQLADNAGSGEESDYALLAREIMGGGAPRDRYEPNGRT